MRDCNIWLRKNKVCFTRLQFEMHRVRSCVHICIFNVQSISCERLVVTMNVLNIFANLHVSVFVQTPVKKHTGNSFIHWMKFIIESLWMCLGGRRNYSLLLLTQLKFLCELLISSVQSKIARPSSRGVNIAAVRWAEPCLLDRIHASRTIYLIFSLHAETSWMLSETSKSSFCHFVLISNYMCCNLCLCSIAGPPQRHQI